MFVLCSFYTYPIKGRNLKQFGSELVPDDLDFPVGYAKGGNKGQQLMSKMCGVSFAWCVYLCF